MGKYEVFTFEEKLVIDYSKLNIIEVLELDIVTYWLLLRDAVVYKHMQTEDGREYLYNCWKLEQTDPERQKLRKNFKKEGDTVGI